jgi:small GTP-binding protein
METDASAGRTELKLVTIGESGVGKTSLLQRLSEGAFREAATPTIGVEYFSWTLVLDQEPVRLMLWDIAGQERFYTVARSYFRDAVGAILVFDITSRPGFDALSKWVRDVPSDAHPNCGVLLIGNKSDLAAQRVISTAEAQEFAKIHSIAYFETSAKDGTNVEAAIVQLATDLWEKAKRGEIPAVGRRTGPDAAKGKDENGCAC